MGLGNRLMSLLFLICIGSSTMLVSCKSKSAVVSANTDKGINAEQIIENLYKNKKDFSTLYIKSSVRYVNDKQTQNVTAEIKIKKNEIILISIRFLGITMAKALITPNEVKFYEKINSSYFEGDYSILSKWLGTDLDFQKVQNMLIGQALDDLKKGKYQLTIEDDSYQLKDISDSNTTKTYAIEGDRFLIKNQAVDQKNEQRNVQIKYSNYMDYNQITLPASLIIDALQKDEKTNINVNYNSVTFNEELSFPYSTPDGYEKIIIN